MNHRRAQGFLLLPVLLLLSLVAGATYLTLRQDQLTLVGELRQSDTYKARAAAEAGLHRAVHEAHRQGCDGEYPTISKPIRDTDFEGASYSAYASRRDGSPVDISADGSYGGAQATLTRKKVVVHSSNAEIIVLQPGPPGKDTSLNKEATKAAPDAETLSVQPDVSEAVMSFDLHAIPEGSHINSAQLTVRITELQGSGEVGLHRIQSDWEETASSTSRLKSSPWIQTIGDAHPMAVASVPTSTQRWMSWRIDDLVDGWIKGRWPNHGLLLRGHRLNSLSLASSDHPIAGLRPRLEVNFFPPCNWKLPRQKQTMVPVADATLSEDAQSLNDGVSKSLRLRNGDGDLHVVMLFDTSSIAKEKTIRKATLRLTFEGLPNNKPTEKPLEIFARRNDDSWSETAATWTHRNPSQRWDQPGALVNPLGNRDPRTIQLPKHAEAKHVVEFDARDWVAWWTEAEANNKGLFLRLPDVERTTLTFGSRESLAAPPVLLIEYE